jgi:nucleoside-diphosphate-sugar epimerase
MRFDLTVSEFTREIYLGRDLLVYDADTWRPYCHVQDFGEVIRRVLEAPVETVNFEVFNAGGSVNNFTKQMIIDGIMESLPDAPVRYQEHGSDPRNYRVDFEKIRNRLHFEPAFTVRDGIRELIESLRQNLFSRVETQPNFFGNYMIDYPVD